MTSSGTFSFNPAASELVLNAFSRCGKSGAVLTPEHLRMASLEANLQNGEWINRGYNLWKQETIQVPAASTLTPGTFQYSVASTVLMITLAWIETGAAPNTIDRVLGPLSAVGYKSITNKLNSGPPTTFWYDRQITPIINLWPVPDSSQAYTLFIQAFTQIQDVVLPGGVTLDTPFRFLDAFTSGLAARLAVHYAPERMGVLQPAAERAWQFATTADTDSRPLSLLPDLSGYFRS